MQTILCTQGTVHALQQIAKAEGSAGLLRGFWPTVWANAPFSAVYYMLYSDLKKRYQKVGSNLDLRQHASAACMG